MPDRRFLFSDAPLSNFLFDRLHQAHFSVQEVEQARLLSSPVNDIVEQLIADHMLTVPELRTDSRSALPPQEVTLEIDDYGRHLRVPGVSVTVRVPFVGEPRLFQYQPSNYDSAPPGGEVWPQELRLTYEWPAHQPINLDEAIQKHLQSIHQYLEWVRGNIHTFNQEVRTLLEQEVSQRRLRLEQATQTVTGLGLPIRLAEEVEPPTARTRRSEAQPSPPPEAGTKLSAGAVNHIRRKSSNAPVPVASKRHYVDPSRIAELRSLTGRPLDVSRLVRLCEELNTAHEHDCHMATAMLVRSIVDHVPPIFGVGKFNDVANQYTGAKSFRGSMQHLQESLRNIADAHLHIQIRKTEVLPTEPQVDFRAALDVLLAEIVRIMK